MTALRWTNDDGILELELCRAPCNEIGSQTLAELEAFLPALDDARALIVHSTMEHGFSSGADLRELFHGGAALSDAERLAGVRDFLERIHAVLNTIDRAPIPTFAACHGIVFGGGFEVALACDMIIADKTTRFAFPELRLGIVPGFGGLPRLKRDVSNALVRDLLFTGRSINARKALETGLVSQVVSAGQALRAARAGAAQAVKFDAQTTAAAKRFLKPFPEEELRREIDLFLELFARPHVQAALRKFVEDEGPMPYLP